MADDEEIEEGEELADDEFGDDDFDGELDDGPLDDDLEIEDEDPIDDEEEKPPSRSGSDDDFTSLDYEQALKVNPKRAKMLRKRARHIEGILDAAELADPKGAAKAWKKLNENTDTKDRRAYNVADEYSENDVIEHAKFGIGFVVEILSDRKIAILFEDGLRRLVCNMKK